MKIQWKFDEGVGKLDENDIKVDILLALSNMILTEEKVKGKVVDGMKCLLTMWIHMRNSVFASEGSSKSEKYNHPNCEVWKAYLA